MAHVFYALNRGENEFQITESATTQTKDIELNIDHATVPSKEDVLLALDKLKNAITTDKEHIWG